MIGHCVNGPARRQMLGDIDRPARPAIRRLRRRALRIGLIGAKVVTVVAGICSLLLVMLLLLAEAGNDPLTTTPSAKPVSAPASQPIRRIT